MAKKILVIDDDLTNTILVQGRLEQKGFEVIVAHDGAQGLEKVKKESPDLIVLDVEMPQMNGYSFMVNLKKIEESQSTPVIVLTSHQEMQPIFQLKGVKGYLLKPINFDDLFSKVNQCLAL